MVNVHEFNDMVLQERVKKLINEGHSPADCLRHLPGGTRWQISVIHHSEYQMRERSQEVSK